MPRPYTFFKHDGAATPPVFDLGEFENDDEARAYASRLLIEGAQYHAIEVWDGVGDPFSVTRKDAGAA